MDEKLIIGSAPGITITKPENRLGSLKLKVATEPILKEVRNLETTVDAGNIYMAVMQSSGIPDWLQKLPNLMKAIKDLEAERGLSAVNIMINTINPGVESPIHRDWIKPTPLQTYPPRIERWHLPILTNPESTLWHKGGSTQHFELGVWAGPVPYWLHHKATNGGRTDRVHIVIDLDCEIPLGDYEP